MASLQGYKYPIGKQSQPKLNQGPGTGVPMNSFQVAAGRTKNAVMGGLKNIAHERLHALNPKLSEKEVEKQHKSDSLRDIGFRGLI